MIPAVLVMVGWLLMDMVSTVADWVLKTDNMVVMVFLVAYWLLAYYQFTNKVYTFLGFVWRIIVTLILLSVILSLLIWTGNALVK